MKWFFSLLLFLCFAHESLAVQSSRPSAIDPRLKLITYHPEGIHHYTGYYDYQASIVLSPDERVKTISMGNPAAWQIVPADNRIFIKPIEDDATTNMLLMTNERVYHFILDAKEVDEAQGINDPNLVFETRFVYPDDGASDFIQLSQDRGPDLSEPEKYNFHYTISGSDVIAPIRIFDDGEFTYFQFSSRNAEVPAFFLVDTEGREALINYRVVGDYIVVERVTSQFTLRHGGDVVCVFNERRPMQKRKKKRVVAGGR